jgi:GDP/UDP-N,N'-diacetylbacillosamine 2-epimerase (hydrolysing)
LKKPTINIGSRQDGRFQLNSIINCKADYNSIIRSVKILYKIKLVTYKVSRFKASSKITSVIKNFCKSADRNSSKFFFDL